VYLCSRKSGYCADNLVINTLKKSNLAFKNEAVEVSFLSVFVGRISKMTLKKETFFYLYIII